jgi:hypothetical protein
MIVLEVKPPHGSQLKVIFEGHFINEVVNTFWF